MISLLLLTLIACTDVDVYTYGEGADGADGADGAPLDDTGDTGDGTDGTDVGPFTEGACTLTLTVSGMNIAAEGALDSSGLWLPLVVDGDLSTCPGARLTDPTGILVTADLSAETGSVDLGSLLVGGPELPAWIWGQLASDPPVYSFASVTGSEWAFWIDAMDMNGSEWGPGWKVSGTLSYGI